jgi:hypothetical protein
VPPPSFFRFSRVDNDLRQDGGDFRQGSEPFQMVPVDGSRPGGIRSVERTIRIASADENIVRIAPGPQLPPVRVISFQATELGSFTLLGGKSPGNTFIVAEDEKGNRVDLLRVSVKAQVPVRYNIVRLRDAITRKVEDDSMALNDAKVILNQVEQLYLFQANVKLTLVQLSDLFVPRNLSDKNGILQLQEISDNKEKIITDAIKANGFGGVDVVFVFTWMLEGAGIIDTTGEGLRGKCFREKGGAVPSRCYIRTPKTGVAHVVVTAHELGHHFGLGHTGLFTPRPSRFLMGAGAGGFKMTQDDINLVNQTGL